MSTLSMTVTRRRALAAGFGIILEALRAYWHRVPTVTFEIGSDR